MGLEMDGSASGAMAQHDPASGRFLPRNTEYRAKQTRVAERLAQLCRDYDTSPAYVQLLSVAARLLDDAGQARTTLARTRASNSAARLLKQIPRKPEPEPPTWADYQARKRKRGRK